MTGFNRIASGLADAKAYAGGDISRGRIARSKAVHLVACVSQKNDAPAPARDLYVSDWFRKARAYVEAQGGPWFILSAEHGLVAPDAVIAPYDRTLSRMSAADRWSWGARVIPQLDAAIAPGVPVVILAGRYYREPLGIWTRGRSTVPMQGLGIGSQKAWLVARTPR